MAVRIERIDAIRCHGGEGPWWDAAGQVLYCLDNTGRRAFRYDPASGDIRTWDFPATITAFALRDWGGAVVALKTGVFLFDLDNGALKSIYDVSDPPTFGFNDGKVDRRGRMMIGASTVNHADPQPTGGLYRLDPDHRLVQLDDGVHYSNGPAWSPDDRTFYFADSWLKTVFAYDYDIASGAVSNKRAFVTTDNLGGLPDGATVDADGRLWSAIYGGGKVAAFAPDGKLEGTIDVPAKYVSSVTFGGPDLDELYVTTISRNDGGPNDEPGAGYLYRVAGLGARGVAEPRFAG